MKWQYAFPELIESFDEMTDATAIQSYVDAVNAAGAERAQAWTREEDPIEATDDELAEASTFHATLAAATARIAALAEEKANKAAKISALAFAPAAGSPPPAPAPSSAGGDAEPDPAGGTGNAGGGTFAVTPKIVTTIAIADFAEGAEMEGYADMGAALAKRWERVANANAGEKFGVMQVRNYIPDSLKLPTDGRAMFTFLQNDVVDESAIVAGFCAPPTVDYGFCGGSSDDRPVLGSMRRYQAPRGRVTKVRTPLFSSVGTDDGEIDDTGLGEWTNDDDDADPFVEKLCSILTCIEDEDFEVYAIYKCVTVKNFLQLAYPEWVAWYMQQLDALWARKAEKKLLDQMRARGGAVITGTARYGAWTSFIWLMNQLANNYTENERYATTPGLKLWMPRWYAHGLMGEAALAGKKLTMDQIESALADVGFGSVTWTMDNPTAVGDYTLQEKGDPLVEYPSQAYAIVSRPDNLRVLDFGIRDIGVTTEREYRDTTTNVRNEFQIFVEAFEGIIDMGCPVWNFAIPACFNGLYAPTAGYDPVCDGGTSTS